MTELARHVIDGLRGRRAVPLWAFSVLLAAATVLGRHVVFSGVIDAGLDRNYITPLAWIDLPLVVIVATVIALFVSLLAAGIEASRASDAALSHGKLAPRQLALLWVLLTAVLLAAWSPYLLTYAPGSVMPDSLYSIAGDRTNHHPIVFTAVVHAFSQLGTEWGDINRGIFAFTIVQSLVMAIALSAGVVLALRRGAARSWAAVSVAYFAFMPVFPIYAISVQKDPLFSLSVALLSAVLFVAADGKGAWLKTAGGIAAFVGASALVLFLRNNGVLVVVGSALAAALLFRRGYGRFYAAVGALLIATLLIQGPGYDALEIRRNTFVESIGIMLQQVGYVVASDGQVTQEQREFLGGMLPYEEWQRAYAPCLVDTLKWNVAFNGQYLNANRPAFLATWAALLRQNPRAYVDAYALTTLGFWKPDATHEYGFADTKVIDNNLGIRQTDLFAEITGVSIRPQLDATRGTRGAGGFLPTGMLIWISLLAAVLLLLRKKGRYALALAPCIALWASVMVATPVAFSLRYIFALAICLPGMLLLPFVQTQGRS